MPVAELHYVDQEIWCRTAYHAEFVHVLKESIPFPYRRWEPSERVWRIDTLYEIDLQEICAKYFDDVLIFNQQTKHVPHSHGDYSILYVTNDAPTPVVDAAYRALSKLFHPDISQEPEAAERMKAINHAYQQIKRERS